MRPGSGSSPPEPGSPPTRRPWLRLALLGVLLAAATVVASTVERPGVPALQAWLDHAGPLGWTAVVLTVSGALMTPVPRTALSVLLGAAAGFPAGLAVAVLAGWVGGPVRRLHSRRSTAQPFPALIMGLLLPDAACLRVSPATSP